MSCPGILYREQQPGMSIIAQTFAIVKGQFSGAKPQTAGRSPFPWGKGAGGKRGRKSSVWEVAV